MWGGGFQGQLRRGEAVVVRILEFLCIPMVPTPVDLA